MLLGWVAAKIERAQVILTGVILLWEGWTRLMKVLSRQKDGRRRRREPFFARFQLAGQLIVWSQFKQPPLEVSKRVRNLAFVLSARGCRVPRWLLVVTSVLTSQLLLQPPLTAAGTPPKPGGFNPILFLVFGSISSIPLKQVIDLPSFRGPRFSEPI